MSDWLARYWETVDALREQRRAPDWVAERDRDLLGRLEDAHDALTEDEQDEVEEQGWRAWPDAFDARTRGAPT